ncbi:MAG: hypothetical protein ABGX10_05750 [Paracoccus sp. (in: a-proteobacteria)]
MPSPANLALQILPIRAGSTGPTDRICETHLRYGYLRVHVLLQREGSQVNINKTRPIYNKLFAAKASASAKSLNLRRLTSDNAIAYWDIP